jgi:hypothetical protein
LLAEDAASYRVTLDRMDSDSVERYLNSNWHLRSAGPALTRFVDVLWRPRWFRRYLREVDQAQFRIVSLLRAATIRAGHYRLPRPMSCGTRVRRLRRSFPNPRRKTWSVSELAGPRQPEWRLTFPAERKNIIAVDTNVLIYTLKGSDDRYAEACAYERTELRFTCGRLQ